jgi:hypothetical protein
MIAPLDIFLTESDGSTVLWKGSETTMEAARDRVRELAIAQPGEYVIQSLQTGHKSVIKLDGSEVQQDRNGASGNSAQHSL